MVLVREILARIAGSKSSSCCIALVLVLAVKFSAVHAQKTAPEAGVRFQPPSSVLLTNATIVVSAERTIESADLLIRDGKISAIGVDLAVPPDAETIDCKDKYLYPALIDAFVEFPTTADSSVAANWNSNVQPQRLLSQQLKPEAAKLEGLRKAGIGIVLAAPDNGIIKGQSCVITTSSKSLGETLLRESAFQHIRLLPERRTREGYPFSPMGAVALVRQTLLDANWYQQALQAFETNTALPAPEVNVALSSLEPVLRAQQTTVIDAPNDLYALRADRFAREFTLKAILRGSGREYRQIDSIAALHRPMIIPIDFPKPPDVSSATAALDTSLQSLMHWYLAPENPGRLEKAGVEFVFTTDGLSSPADLLGNIKKAIKRGCSEKTALQSITSLPAKLLEIEHLAGTLDSGKFANILVTNGPLFSESTKILETYVAGQREVWSEEQDSILSGSWQLAVADLAEIPQLELKLSGPSKKLKGELGLVGAFAAPKKTEADTAKEAKADEKSTEAEKQAEVKKSEDDKEDSTNESDDEKKGESEDKDSESEKETDEAKSASKLPAKTELKQLSFTGYRLTASFNASTLRESVKGTAQVSAVVTDEDSVEEFTGKIYWPDGNVSSFLANRTEAPIKNEADDNAADEPKQESQKSRKDTEDKAEKKSDAEVFACDVNFPLGAYGVTGKPELVEWVLVRGATVWTCAEAGTIENADLLIHFGYIEAVGKHLDAPEGAMVVDAKGLHVTPGIIDCHSHMATDGGVNEGSQAVTSEVRVGDFIDPTDITIYRQLAGGVTTANILHGSANPIGGQNQVVKLRWGASDAEMRMSEAPAGIKFALGENVKRASSEESANSRYPFSRMGVEQIIQDRFEAAKAYRKKQKEWSVNPSGLPPRRDLELDAIAEILEGNRWIHCHSYRQDEILAFLRTLEAYDVTVGSLQHILEGYKVADAMARHGATGSTFSDWWAYKMEVQDAIPFNGAIMHNAGIIVSFNSDDDELARHLNHEAAKAVKYGGLAPEEALKFVTLNPAKQLRIDDYVGSLEAGKQADFVLWNGPPLSTLSVCTQTWIDGRKYFDREEDLKRRVEDSDLHRRLVQRILESGEKMSDQSQDRRDPSTWWLRYDEFCTSRK